MIEKIGRLIGRTEVIALATDGSSYTDGAAQEAIFRAQACGAKLVVLHVIAINAESEFGAGVLSTISALREEISGHIDKFLQMAKDA
jgi:nucleotide-binding universal stress UspA family protein